jgi:hypothetical protein
VFAPYYESLISEALRACGAQRRRVFLAAASLDV